MKCLIYVGDNPDNQGKVIRTNRHVADRKLSTGDWWFIDKEAWKAYKRSKHERNLENSE